MKKCATCKFSIFDENLGEYKCGYYERYTVNADKNCEQYIEKSKKDE